MADYRAYIPTKNEIIDLCIAVAALTIGFSMAIVGGFSGVKNFIVVLPVAFVAILISFPLHEYMHKIVAQRFGAIAAFKRSDTGILLTIATGFLGILFGMPGATMIYTNNFTVKEEGYVSIAGPLTNLAIFAVLFAISFIPAINSNAYFMTSLSFILFINLWLAFFNMLPLYPLDGSKVLRWNKPVYATTMAVLIALLFYIEGIGIVYSILIVLVIAFIMSSLYRGMIFRGP
ncbi:MAG: site-2 protease family protein [Candidatus Marsarchaeota archaeon]|jgi:Zn-dependent protease|nr:site-2 protease family protein [Candidatus Marsarchaeota archaeon]